jgi:hypothetical protein
VFGRVFLDRARELVELGRACGAVAGGITGVHVQIVDVDHDAGSELDTRAHEALRRQAVEVRVREAVAARPRRALCLEQWQLRELAQPVTEIETFTALERRRAVRQLQVLAQHQRVGEVLLNHRQVVAVQQRADPRQVRGRARARDALR